MYTTRQCRSTCLQVSSSFLQRKQALTRTFPLFFRLSMVNKYSLQAPQAKNEIRVGECWVLTFHILLTGKQIPSSLYLNNFLYKDTIEKDPFWVRLHWGESLLSPTEMPDKIRSNSSYSSISNH